MDALEPRGSNIELAALLRCQLVADQLKMSRARSFNRQAGAKRSVLQGRGMDFDEVRPYQAGDDIRAMDWRVTARTGKPHTKLFKEEKEQPIYLVVDLRRPMFFGSVNCFKSVLAAQCAAMLSWSALKDGNRVGALIMGDNGIVDIPAKRSQNAVLHIFDAMIKQRPSTTTRVSWQDAGRQLQHITTPNSAVWLISDFHDLSDDCLRRLSAKQRLAFHIQDPLELALPVGHTVAVTKENTQVAVQLNRTSSKRYSELQQAQQQRIADILQNNFCPRLTLSTDSSLLRALRQFIARGCYGQ